MSSLVLDYSSKAVKRGIFKERVSRAKSSHIVKRAARMLEEEQVEWDTGGGRVIGPVLKSIPRYADRMGECKACALSAIAMSVGLYPHMWADYSSPGTQSAHVKKYSQVLDDIAFATNNSPRDIWTMNDHGNRESMIIRMYAWAEEMKDQGL